MASDLRVSAPEAEAEVVGDRRRRAARGALVNAAWLIGLNVLGLLRGFVVAAFLTAGDYGTWGLLIAAFSTVLALAQVGVDDKYVQQRAPDQQQAFAIAFTLQCLLSALFVAISAAAIPLAALAYGDTRIIVPGLVLLLALAAVPFQTPLWTFYRRMDYLQQRRLQAFDPLTSFVVTVALAAAGAGYWALVIGVVAGTWAAALAAVRAAPYPFALRFDRASAREYWSFSGPLFLSGIAVSVIVFVPVLVARHSAGVAAVGIITLASTISNYATRVDEVVTNTLYPAICAVRDRRDVLLESFLKSNRIALLWAIPLGAGVALFAGDFVAHVLGGRWRGAVYPIQALAVAAAINQVGFNASAFFRAIGRTQPLAWLAWVMMAAVLAFAVPLLVADGVDGYATGMILAGVALVCARLFFLRQLFPLGPIFANVARALGPTLPALGLVLLARLAEGSGSRGAGLAVGELVLFVAAVATATVLAERPLLTELRGYLRRDVAAPLAAE